MMNVMINGTEYTNVEEAMRALKVISEKEKPVMIKNLGKNVVKNYPDFHIREDLNFTDDGNRFKGFDYKGLPITTLRTDGTTYLSIREDYVEDRQYTWREWHATEEHYLTDEFNGVEEIDLNKLIENCEKIISKMDELNNAVKDKHPDLTKVNEQLVKEKKMIDDFVETVKRELKWWTLERYKLSSASRYLSSLELKSSEIKRMLDGTENMDRKRKQELVENLEAYGYIVEHEDGFYIKELNELMAQEA